MGSVVSYTPLASRSTITGTTTIGPEYVEKDVSISGTLTITTSSIVIVNEASTVTLTRLTLPTHHAICDENSGNCKSGSLPPRRCRVSDEHRANRSPS